MSLILFLIVTFGLLCKICGTKAKKARYDREYQEFTYNLEKGHAGFEDRLASKEETEQLRLTAFYEKGQYERKSPPNDETREAREMRRRICSEVGIQPNPEMIVCGILAQTGRVPYEMKWSAYTTSNVEPRREYWKVENLFMKWLDMELRKHGMPFSMRYVTVDNRLSLGFGNDDAISESVQQDNTQKVGTYYWTNQQARSSKKFLTIKPYQYNDPYVEY